MNFKLNAKEYVKIKDRHARYLITYKLMNGGSDAGATSLNKFYLFWTYTLKYDGLKVRASLDMR